MKLEHLLYLFIIIILAIFMGYYVKDIGLLSVKEGARTYPMPRLHPLKQKYGSFQGDSQSNVISMNKIIDEFIARYFDQNGVPYLNTIDDVQSYIVGPGTTGPYNYGAISDQMKSELTDIGYYLIEMVLPALPTVENRKPNQELPLLKLSGMPGFEMEVANVPKCMVYKGSSDTNLRFIYNNPQSSLLSKFQQGFDSIFDTNDYNQSSTTTSSSSGSEGSGTGGTTSDKCAPNRVDCPSDCCGITCPQQCFQNALEAAAPASSSSTDSSSGSADGSGSMTNTGNPYHSTINAAQIFNNMTSSLTHTNNSETICPSQTIGYDITQIPLTKDTIQNTILKNKIQKDVLEYFTSYQKSTTQFEPTEKLKNMIEFYSTQYSPMDQFHYELLRELIYYVLQVIIPGMPTPALPYLYIEWRSFLKYQ